MKDTRETKTDAKPRSPSIEILESLHERVETLIDHVHGVADPFSVMSLTTLNVVCERDAKRAIEEYMLREEDTDLYRELVTKVLVAETAIEVSGARKTFAIRKSESAMAEVIDRALSRLFAKNHRPSNVMALGYRSSVNRSDVARGGYTGARIGVTNYFVNTMIEALKSPEWCLLLDRLGDDMILHMLTDSSIFSPLPNDCYCQLTGPPLIYSDSFKQNRHRLVRGTRPTTQTEKKASAVKRKVEDGDAPGCLRKRRRIAKAQTETTGSHRRKATRGPSTLLPVETRICRTSMFYGRPHRSDKGRMVLGLASNSILVRMSRKFWLESHGVKDSSERRPADRNDALEARHLSKYIFPRQYNLSSSFVKVGDIPGKIWVGRHFWSRETEIRECGSSKTPARLKRVLPLLGQLFQRSTKCKFKLLLDKFCSSKLKPSFKDTAVDKSVILEFISEDLSGIHLDTQADFSVSDVPSASLPVPQQNGLREVGASIAKMHRQTNYKPRFAEFSCNYTEVFLFVCAVTSRIIPHEIWGCKKNKAVAMHYVKQMITSRRNETLTLHTIMQGMSTSECEWLLPSQNGKNTHLHQSEAEMKKRRELLEEFLFWYFDQFLLQLLKTTFFITDSSAYRSRVLYFRQDDWDVLCKPLVERLASTTFERIEKHEAEALLRRRKLGFSFVRLLPKENGVRPIVNLRRKGNVDSSSASLSINQILSSTFQILAYEKTAQKEKLGASVFGPSEVYEKLRGFKSRLVGADGNMPKLYFVKVDVQACFDTIEQGKLLQVMLDIISQDAYMVQKYGKVLSSKGRGKRWFMRNALPESEHPHFLTYATQLAAMLRHTILVDQVIYPFAFREDVIELLQDHISSNIVKIGRDYYRQKVGIPQGSVLSSLLCSFFYGDLERGPLAFVNESSSNKVLLRLIDDYLFITTDQREARTFLNVMNKGHPEYGCFIAREKTLTNFEHHIGTLSQLSLSTVIHPDRKNFPWCGFLINTNDLSVTADYSRFHDSYLMDSLSLEIARRQNSAFWTKLVQNCKAKVHPIFTDTSFNPSRIVRVNMYQTFALAAMRMHIYIIATKQISTAFTFVPRSSNVKDAFKEKKKRQRFGPFVLKAIRHAISCTYATLSNRASRSDSSKQEFRFDLSKDEVLWLGYHAFHGVLSIKRTVYAETAVLRGLALELHRSRNHGVKRHNGSIAKESLRNLLIDINF